MAERKKSDRPRIRAQISEQQDDAVDRVVREMSKRRGNTVSRADIAREGLALFFRANDQEWPC